MFGSTPNIRARSLGSIAPLLCALITMGVTAACGDSEAYYVVNGEKIPANPSITGAGGLGDVSISPTVLRFPADGGPITLDASQVAQAFGMGGSSIKDTKPLNGLVVSWDGQKTDAYCRSHNSSGAGAWVLAELLAEQEGSFRVTCMAGFAAESIDLYFKDAQSISFIVIEGS